MRVETHRLFEEFQAEVPEQFWGDLEDEDPREVQAMFLAARGDIEGAIDEFRPLPAILIETGANSGDSRPDSAKSFSSHNKVSPA